MRKKLITMGLVSALGASTSAIALDLDNPKDVPQTYATDAVVAADLTADGLVNLGAGIQMIETSTINVGISSQQKRFIRVDLTNAEFSNLGVAGTGTLTATGTTTPSATGGTPVLLL